MYTWSWRRRGQLRRSMLAGCAAFGLAAGLAGQVFADTGPEKGLEQQVQTFDIPAQDLSAALQRWASIAGLDWAHVGGSLEAIQSAGVSGSMTADEALGRILAGTGFSYDVLPSGGISIVPIDVEPVA